MDYNADTGVSESRVGMMRGKVAQIWSAYRPKILIGIVATLVIYALLETLHQVRIQRALAHAEQGEYSKALESLEGRRLGLFRNGLADAVTAQARYHLARETLTDAVESANWFVAEQSLRTTLETAQYVESAAEDIDGALEAWHAGLSAQIAKGELARCRQALDHLLAVPLEDSSHQQLVSEISHDAVVGLFNGFVELEAWAPARKELQAFEEHPLREPGQEEKLRERLRSSMNASMAAAVAQREFQRAEAIQKLLASYFPDAGPSRGMIDGIRFQKRISSGKRFESEGSFDQALEAYDEALRMKPGSLEAFGAIQALRDRLRSYTKHGRNQWVRGTHVADDDPIAQARSVIKRGYNRRTLYMQRRKTLQPATIRNVTLYSRSSNLKGKWSARLEESGGELAWIVSGEIETPSGSYYSKPLGGVKVAALVSDRNEEPLSAQIEEFPLMLAGDRKTFEFRFPSTDSEWYMQVGVSK